MAENLENLIRENNELLKENQKMLKKLRGAQKSHFYAKVFYWVVIIAVMLGGYFWIQPYLQSLKDTYTEVVDKFNQAQGTVQDLNDSRQEIQGNVQDLLQLLP